MSQPMCATRPDFKWSTTRRGRSFVYENATAWIGPMATAMLRKRSKGGRRPSGRVRHMFNPSVEQHVYEELAHQADELSMPLSTYIEHLLAEAHDYHGQYLRSLSVLPAPLTVEELKERTQSIGRDECVPVKGERRYKSFKADEELAVKIAARCDELDAQYADYLRAVFRVATGYADGPTQEQLSMVDVPRSRKGGGEVELQRTG